VISELDGLKIEANAGFICFNHYHIIPANPTPTTISQIHAKFTKSQSFSIHSLCDWKNEIILFIRPSKNLTYLDYSC